MKDPDQDIGIDRLIAALKPILGPGVDKLWLETKVGTEKGRERARKAVYVLSVRYLGTAPGDEQIRLEPPPAGILGGGPLVVGSVVYPSTLPHVFTMYPSELLRHVLVLGASGGGKTTFLLGILQQVRVPWAALDWKRNYRVLLHHPDMSDLVVLTVGSDVAPLRINMLRPPRGVAAEEWVEAVSDTICAGYLLMVGARKMLKDSLLDAINDHGERATLRDALPYLRLRSVKARYRESGWLESASRAVDEMTTGAFGAALNARDGAMTMSDLLDRRVVFELEGLGYDQGKTFCVFYLQTLKLTRKRQSLAKEVLHHVTLSDEAHNVFTKEKRGDPPNVQSTVARELRELGEGIITSTQQTDISESIIANSKTTIAFETRFPWDVKLLSDLLQVDYRYLGKIPLGQGIVRLPERWKKAFLFQFPTQPIKNKPTTDEFVRARYLAWRGTTSTPEDVPVSPALLREKDIALVLDVARFPISTVTERYARLGWNPNAGTTTKDRLIRDGLATFTEIELGRTRAKILTLTTEGERIASEHGLTVTAKGPAGLEHELWRSRLTERCQNRGYTVTSEYRLPDGKRVDLHIQRGNNSYLMEIETGKSNVEENIQRAAGHGTLIVFFTNNAALEKAQAFLPPGVLVFTPDTSKALLAILQ